MWFLCGLILGLVAWPAVIFGLLLWGGHAMQTYEQQQDAVRRPARAA